MVGGAVGMEPSILGYRFGASGEAAPAKALGRHPTLSVWRAEMRNCLRDDLSAARRAAVTKM